MTHAPLLTAGKRIAAGRGLAPALLARAPEVALDWDTRRRSRFEASASDGRRLGVFLPRGQVLRGGDVLVADDGTLIRVVAAAQPVMVVRAAHGAPLDLLRASYHLGNRHVPLELRADHLKLEPDPVLAAMLRALALDVSEALAAFEPETGAYAEHPGAHPGGGHAHPHGPHDHGGLPSAHRHDPHAH
jgi:urease accessory protein